MLISYSRIIELFGIVVTGCSSMMSRKHDAQTSQKALLQILENWESFSARSVYPSGSWNNKKINETAWFCFQIGNTSFVRPARKNCNRQVKIASWNFISWRKMTKYIGFLIQPLCLHQIKNSFLFFREVSFSEKNATNFVVGSTGEYWK